MTLSATSIAPTSGVVAHAARPRVLFIDLLRFVAAFQMIQGHTIAAVLAPQHRAGIVHAVWASARGLTSVAFLLAAGMSFYFATASAPSAARGRRKRVARAARLIAIGYLLRLPVHALAGDDAAAWRGFFAVDVLQCIGVALLSLEAAAWLLRPRRVFAAFALCAGVALLALARSFDGLVRPDELAPLAGYLSARAGSLFPLVPWAGHVLLGAAVAHALWAHAPALSAATRLLVASAAALAVTVPLGALGASAVAIDHVERASCVLLASAGLAWVAARLPRLPTLVMKLSSETLALYVFHVLLVYGAGVGLGDRLGMTLGPAAAVALAGLVVAASSGVALTYRRVRWPSLAGSGRTG